MLTQITLKTGHKYLDGHALFIVPVRSNGLARCPTDYRRFHDKQGHVAVAVNSSAEKYLAKASYAFLWGRCQYTSGGTVSFTLARIPDIYPPHSTTPLAQQ